MPRGSNAAVRVNTSTPIHIASVPATTFADLSSPPPHPSSKIACAAPHRRIVQLAHLPPRLSHRDARPYIQATRTLLGHDAGHEMASWAERNNLQVGSGGPGGVEWDVDGGLSVGEGGADEGLSTPTVHDGQCAIGS
jgi:hypothetical protein